jgi:hypothetical protein
MDKELADSFLVREADDSQESSKEAGKCTTFMKDDGPTAGFISNSRKREALLGVIEE